MSERISKYDEIKLPKFFTKPRKQDKILIAAVLFVLLFGISLRFIKVWLLNNPIYYALVSGSYGSAIVGGAKSLEPNSTSWFIIVLIAAISSLKFLLLNYYMGKLWGEEIVELLFVKGTLLRKTFDKFLHVKNIWIYTIMAIGAIPFVPFLSLVSIFIAGMKRLKIPVILLMLFCVNLVIFSLFALLGRTFGEEVIEIIEFINKYALIVTLIIVIVPAFVSSWKRRPVEKNNNEN